MYMLFSTGGLDEPILRPYVERDWRFGHYEMEGLQDPFSRFLRYVLQPFSLKSKLKARKGRDKLILQPLEVSILLFFFSPFFFFSIFLGTVPFTFLSSTL